MTIDLFGAPVRFADPVVLALLLVVPALAYVAFARERRAGGALLFSSLTLIPGRRRAWRTRLRPALIGLRALALVLLIAALARPQVVRASEISAEGIDIAIVLDISGSMGTPGLSRNTSVTKLDTVKRVVIDFVSGLRNDRAGLVIFGSEALLLSPLTLDHNALKELTQPIESTQFVGGATAIGVGLATGLNVLRESNAKSKVAILLTDGENNVSTILPADAAKAARLLGVRVYTIGAIPTSERQRGSVQVNEAEMRDIAESTGGRYFSAGDEGALRQIYDEIALLERTRIGVRTEYAAYEDVMLPFLLAGAMLLVLEALFGLTLLRRTP
jgi:Ca-activated chloride channel family protein